MTTILTVVTILHQIRERDTPMTTILTVVTILHQIRERERDTDDHNIDCSDHTASDKRERH